MTDYISLEALKLQIADALIDHETSLAHRPVPSGSERWLANLAMLASLGVLGWCAYTVWRSEKDWAEIRKRFLAKAGGEGPS